MNPCGVFDDLLREPRDCIPYVFAVIEDKQRPLPCEYLDEALARRPALSLVDREDRDHRGRNRAGVGDCSEVAEPHPIREHAYKPIGNLDRKPGLADPARPGQRDVPCGANDLRHRVHLAVTTHVRGHRARQGRSRAGDGALASQHAQMEPA